MSEQKIYAMFVEVLAKHFEIEGDQVHRSARLVEDLDLDSLDRIALGAEIEEKSGVALTEEEVRGCETLGDLVERMSTRIADRGR